MALRRWAAAPARRHSRAGSYLLHPSWGHAAAHTARDEPHNCPRAPAAGRPGDWQPGHWRPGAVWAPEVDISSLLAVVLALFARNVP